MLFAKCNERSLGFDSLQIYLQKESAPEGHFFFGAGDGRSIGFDSLQIYLQKESAPEGHFFLEQATGIEPACLAWEASALPLSYACIVDAGGIDVKSAKRISL